MKTLTRAYAISAAICLAVFAPITASAASVSVFLNLSNESVQFPSDTNYLEVTIADGLDGAIDFRVETTDALKSIADSNFGIQSFSLNFGDTGATAMNLALPDGWSAEKAPANSSVFGIFDVQIAGTGSSRLDPLEFSIVGVAGDTPFDYLAELYEGRLISSGFAAHVAGFSLSGENGRGRKLTSAQFGGSAPVVPLPASAWFMLSGLGILALRAKLSKRQDAEKPADHQHFDMGLPA
jgi:hypothetical protein